jgi:tetratricopeptide (TPR) repeat protein
MQFSFDLTASATVFWLALAIAAALGRAHPSPSTGRNRKPGKSPMRRNLYLLPPCLAVLAIIGTICLRPLLADVAYWKSQDPNRPSVERVEASIRAVRLWSLEPTYRLGLVWYLVQVGDMPAAEAQLAATTRLAPDDPRVWTAWGDLYMAWGERDADRYEQAEEAYQELLALAPNVARYHMAMGLALAKQDRLEEGVAETEQAASLDATDAIIYRQLADLYWALGQEDAASQAKATYDQLMAWEENKQ